MFPVDVELSNVSGGWCTFRSHSRYTVSIMYNIRVDVECKYKPLKTFRLISNIQKRINSLFSLSYINGNRTKNAKEIEWTVGWKRENEITFALCYLYTNKRFSCRALYDCVRVYICGLAVHTFNAFVGAIVRKRSVLFLNFRIITNEN